MKYSACVVAALLVASGCTQNADSNGPGVATEVRVINIKPPIN